MTDSRLDLSAPRHLVVIRHGEAKASSASGDEGRELTAGGRKDAEQAGRWLVEQGITPDVALVSSATRTQQTWEALQAGGVTAEDVQVDATIYNGSVEDVMEALGSVPDSARVVLVVAHSPAVPEIAYQVDTDCDVPEGWAPATVGVIALTGEWSDGIADATLVACRTPTRARGLVD